ncbi:MAG: hypothetical protein [Siphoviridae sp. ctjeG17]|nr:MAG: hypothetical protein [Siphoviridae sp. ctjeG17]
MLSINTYPKNKLKIFPKMPLFYELIDGQPF